MEESQNAYRKYEAILEGPELQQSHGGENPSNIPGGVSQTSKLAGGGKLQDNAAGLETLADGE